MYDCVTVWHKENGKYKRILFERSVARKNNLLEGSALGEKIKEDNRIILFSLYDKGIKVGDRVCIGYDEANIPPKDSCIITEMDSSFNVSAPLRHYRIRCR